MIPKNGWFGWVLAAICALIAVSCIPGKHVAVSGRVIGGFVFLTCLWYLGTQYLDPGPGGNRATPSFKNAWSLFTLWGLPAGFVAIFGYYPSWAKLGDAFGRSARR